MNVTQEDAPTVVVIDSRSDQASTLKTMIEFLDTPDVTVVDVEQWPTVLSSRQVKAVFLGPGLTPPETSNICQELQQQYSTIPVVVVGGADVDGA